MEKYQNAITDDHGNIVIGATITVTVYGTTTPAVIYSGNGTGQYPSNVITTDSQGQFAFYAANGRYTYTVTATDFLPETYSDILLFDPSGSGGSVDATAVNYLQSGTGAQVRTAASKMSDTFNVGDFGAVGNGSWDDTSAIQAAINAVFSAGGGTVFFDAKNYKLTSVTIYTGVYLQGQGSRKRGDKAMTLLTGTAGYNIIVLNPLGCQDMAIRHLSTYGGQRSISFDPTTSTPYISNFELYDLCLGYPSAECIFIGGQAERLLLNYIYFAQGTYGYYQGIGNTGRPYAIFEKSTWSNIYMEGQSINGIFYNTVAVSGSTTYNFMKIISSGRECIRFKGNVGGLTFTDILFEDTATSQPTVANTTGTMTAGSYTLTLASASNFVNGQQITVSGAGYLYGVIAWGDLETTIVSGAGTTTLTLAAPAAYAVTSVPVTNRLYDNVKFEGIAGQGRSVNITFIGCYLDGGFAKARYLINTGGNTFITLVSTVGAGGGPTGTPIYDPLTQVSFVNATSGVRYAKDPANPRAMGAYFRGEISSIPVWSPLGSAATAEYPPTLISSNPGQNITFVLDDTNYVGTGTLGNWEIYGVTPNYDALLRLTGGSGITNATFQLATRLCPPTIQGSGSYVGFSNASMSFGTSYPTTGTWYTGSVVFNVAPAAGQPTGWQCIAGSISGGTWKAMPDLTALP